jgi:2-dehydro-3-deoxyphosphogluconate aldolase/(4S)-4-hydroxy-2-oxoglutarate aldolase
VARTIGNDVIKSIAAGGIVPVVALAEAAAADQLARALLRGGMKCAEVTFRTEAAAEAIKAMAAYPELLVGAGTVLSRSQVDQAVDAGARFIVSPGFSAAVVAHCLDRCVPIFPGVATPTEIQMALEAGVETVKFFPAEQLGGAPTVKALSAAFRSVRFIPTGGVSTANLTDYLALPSVLAVGGTWMVAPDLLSACRWDDVTARTRSALAKVGDVRA